MDFGNVPEKVLSSILKTENPTTLKKELEFFDEDIEYAKWRIDEEYSMLSTKLLKFTAWTKNHVIVYLNFYPLNCLVSLERNPSK